MKYNAKSLLKIVIAMMLSVSIIKPSFVMAEDQIDTTANESKVENTIVFEENEESVQPSESILPENSEEPLVTEQPVSTETPEEQLPEPTDIPLDEQPMAMNRQSNSIVSENDNVLIKVNIDNVKASITENNATKDLEVKENRITALCKTTCQITVDGTDATVKSASLNDNEIYNVDVNNDYKSAQIIDVDNSDRQIAIVNFGYKLTVTTHYMPNEGEHVDGNGKIKWGSSVTVEKMNEYQITNPTSYTKVLLPGETLEVYPQPTEGYPLRLMEFNGVVTSKNVLNSYEARHVPFGTTASDSTDEWYKQSQMSNLSSNTRYIALTSMPSSNATIDYAYNYGQKAVFVGVYYENVEGKFIPEEYTGGDVSHLKTLHHKEIIVDGKEIETINPSSSIFGEAPIYPVGTTIDDYLYDKYWVSDDGKSKGYIYYSGWSDSDQAIGANFMKAMTGLDFINNGNTSGVMTLRLENRNYFFYHYYRLYRTLNYNSNDGTNKTVNGGKTILNGEITTIENTFVRDGYTFKGWNTEPDGNGVNYTEKSKFVMPAVKEITLYAQWERDNAATPIPTPEPTETPNVGCPAGTEWNEERQDCLAPIIPQPQNPQNPQPNQPEERIIVDEITPEQGPTVTPTATPDVEKIEDDITPEVVHKGSWALINLIASLIGMLVTIILLFAKHEKEEENEENEELVDEFKRKRIYKVVGVIITILSIIVFVLTENMRLPMILVDKYTLLMVVLAILNLVCFYFGRKWHEVELEEATDQTKE